MISHRASVGLPAASVQTAIASRKGHCRLCAARSCLWEGHGHRRLCEGHGSTKPMAAGSGFSGFRTTR